MKDIFKNHWWICRDFINELFYSITRYLGLKFVKNRTAVVKVDSSKSLNVNLRERETKKCTHVNE